MTGTQITSEVNFDPEGKQMGYLRALNVKGSVYAADAGLFEPLKVIGEDVAEREIVALIHRPETPEQTPAEVTSPFTGLVLAKRAVAQARRGDALYRIAADAA